MPNTITIHGRHHGRSSATLEVAKRFTGRVTIVTIDVFAAAELQSRARKLSLDHVRVVTLDDAEIMVGLGSVIVEPDVRERDPEAVKAILDRAQAERRAKRPPLPNPTRRSVYGQRNDSQVFSLATAVIVAAAIVTAIVLAGVLL